MRIVVRRHDEDPRRGVGRDDPARGFETAHSGHLDVHQHPVGTSCAVGGDRIVAVRALVKFVHEVRQDAPDQSAEARTVSTINTVMPMGPSHRNVGRWTYCREPRRWNTEVSTGSSPVGLRILLGSCTRIRGVGRP